MVGDMINDRVMGMVRVWLDHVAPPITSNEGELDLVKLLPLALQQPLNRPQSAIFNLILINCVKATKHCTSFSVFIHYNFLKRYFLCFMLTIIIK